MSKRARPEQTVHAVVPPPQPIRVAMARDILQLFNYRETAQAAANSTAIEWRPGLDLRPTEEGARDAAADCLARYFDGKLEPDHWDTVAISAYLKAAGVAIEGDGDGDGGHPPDGPRNLPLVDPIVVGGCPNCREPGNTNCPVCGGEATLAICPNYVFG